MVIVWAKVYQNSIKGVNATLVTNRITKIGQLMLPGFLVAYAILMRLVLADYIPWTSVNFILGCLALPVAFHNRNKCVKSSRFLYASLAMCVLSFLFPVQMTLFFAMVAALIFLVEHHFGKLPSVTFIILFCMSPTLQYLAGVFSFPIRLWLTGLSGGILRLAGLPATVAGNMITIGQQQHSVDPACMGIKMFLTSLLCGLFVLLVLQQRQKKSLKAGWILVSLLMVFALNLLANIIRILILVYFNIPPNNLMHELTGIGCLWAYVIIPFYFLGKMIVDRKGKETHLAVPDTNSHDSSSAIKTTWRWHFVVLGMVCISCLVFQLRNAPDHNLQSPPMVDGYTGSIYGSDVFQYTNSKSLVYIKKIKGFAYAEHNPVMCWLGSGFEFETQEETLFNGQAVFTGTLKKDNSKLYTAWWYENRHYITINQLDWRWRVLRGDANFSVVNVTASDPATLHQLVADILKEHTFRVAIQ